jgi:hypothetical protein
MGTVGVMAQNDREISGLFHDATKHTVESVRGGGGAPTTLVLSGIPWRTTWKYGERGYRHLF